MSIFRNNILGRSILEIFRVWKREFRLIFKDLGVVTFFLALPTIYPIVYSLIYNPEIAREVPVVVVDDCRTDVSREFTRELNASQFFHVVDYAANRQEAKRMMDEKECYGILCYPQDFSQKIGRGEQATVQLYAEMSLLLRYKSMLMALTSVSQNMGAKVQLDKINDMSAAAFVPDGGATPIPYKSNPVGNTSTGLASALLPGIIVLILQQSILLGVCMLEATSRERARKNNGYDPLQVKNTSVLNMMIGKALCYFVVMVVPAIYILHYVPMFFSFPQNGSPINTIAFVVPYLFASIFFAMTAQSFVRDREASFLVAVFTSIFFLFLSGLSWPRYAMSPFWYLAGDCIPATWGINGYISMKTAGATLVEQAHPYRMLWLLTLVYFVLSYCVIRFVQRPRLTGQNRSGLTNL